MFRKQLSWLSSKSFTLDDSRNSYLDCFENPITFLVEGRVQIAPLTMLSLHSPSSQSWGMNVSLVVKPSPSTTGTYRGGNQFLYICGPQRMAVSTSSSPICPSITSVHLPNSSPAISPTSLHKPSNLSIPGRTIMQRSMQNIRPPEVVAGIWEGGCNDGLMETRCKELDTQQRELDTRSKEPVTSPSKKLDTRCMALDTQHKEPDTSPHQKQDTRQKARDIQHKESETFPHKESQTRCKEHDTRRKKLGTRNKEPDTRLKASDTRLGVLDSWRKEPNTWRKEPINYSQTSSPNSTEKHLDPQDDPGCYNLKILVLRVVYV